MNPVTPKGYRRLVNGETMRVGDKKWDEGRGPWVAINERAQGVLHIRKRGYSHWPVIRKIT